MLLYNMKMLFLNFSKRIWVFILVTELRFNSYNIHTNTGDYV